VELPLADGIGQGRQEATHKTGELAEETEPESDRKLFSPPAGAKQRVILYIEDNPDLLRMMESLVKRQPDARMISAHNAELGLVLAEKESPDLILMDINLPGMNGIEARRQLLLNDKTAHIPVVAVSGAAMKHDIERAMNAGFQAYLTKPFTIGDAVRTIRDALNQAN
jgi:CheY-like chemotaxis protein